MQRVHTFRDVSACLSVHSVQREYSGGRRRGGWKFLMYPSETTTTHQHSSHFIFLFIGIRCSDRRQAIRDSRETQLPLAAWATVLPFVVCRLHVVQGLHRKASTLFVWCRCQVAASSSSSSSALTLTLSLQPSLGQHAYNMCACVLKCCIHI